MITAIKKQITQIKARRQAGLPAGRQGMTIQKVKTSHKGRKCRFPHCKHILSIYNHEAYCHIHLGQVAHEHRPKFSKT